MARKSYDLQLRLTVPTRTLPMVLVAALFFVGSALVVIATPIVHDKCGRTGPTAWALVFEWMVAAGAVVATALGQLKRRATALMVFVAMATQLWVAEIPKYIPGTRDVWFDSGRGDMWRCRGTLRFVAAGAIILSIVNFTALIFLATDWPVDGQTMRLGCQSLPRFMGLRVVERDSDEEDGEGDEREGLGAAGQRRGEGKGGASGSSGERV